MVARDLTGKSSTEPVPYKINPDYDEKDGSPKYLPAEPHIGLSGVNDDPKPPSYQTGVVAGGTSNPPKGDDGSVKRITQKPGDADPNAKALGGDFGAFDEATKDNPTISQHALNDAIGDTDKEAEVAKAREAQVKREAKSNTTNK